METVVKVTVCSCHINRSPSVFVSVGGGGCKETGPILLISLHVIDF